MLIESGINEFGFSPSVWERIKDVIAKAAPPSERAAAVYLDPVQDDATEAARLHDLMEKWKCVSGANTSRLIDLMASLELSEAELRDRLRSVVCKDRAVFPEWVHGITSFLSVIIRGLVGQNDPTSDDALGDLRALNNQLKGIARASITPIISASTLSIAETAKSDMAALFAARAMKALGPSITFEKNLAAMQARINGNGAPEALDLSSEGWLCRLELRPCLAFVLGSLFHFWRRNLAECLDRLESDQDAIVKNILDSTKLGELIGFKGNAGDPHDGGRSVAILHFAEGLRIVYKSKGLQVAEAFLNLVAHLNNPPIPLNLKCQRILGRDGYGWEEFVTFETCKTKDEVGCYFTRMGMWIRLLQLCGGRDFWLDNIVAHGAYPCLIDLETLLQGPDPAVRRSLASSDPIMEILEDSVLSTAAVVSHVRIANGIQAEDMGSLTPQRVLRTPFKAPNGRDFVEWTPPGYAPIHNGKPSQVNDYLDELLMGYSSLHDAICACSSGLLSVNGAILEALKAPVRYIVRDTWTYYNIIEASLLPQALEDGITREFTLCRLFKNWSGTPTHAQIITAEIDALRNCDIPLFHTKPDTRSLYSSTGKNLGPYFDRPAFEMLYTRLLNIETFDLKLHMDILLSALETGAAGPSGLSTPVLPTAPSSQVNLARVARDIALSIMKNHVSEKGRPCWLGLVYDPACRTQLLQELRYDLFTGNLGLACTFAEVFQATEVPELAQMTQLICNSIPDFDCEPEMQYSGLARFFGHNAAAYTLAHCGNALKNMGLQERARSMLEAQAGKLQQDLAGWLYTNMRLQIPLRLKTPRILEEICDGTNPSLFSIECMTPFEPFVAETGVVILAALDTTDEAGFGSALSSKLRKNLDIHYSARLRDATLGYGSLSALCNTRLLPQVIDIIDQMGLTCPEQNDSTHILLLRAQLALASFSATTDSRFYNDASKLATILHHRFVCTGSWFPDRFAADQHNLSGVWGVSSIARVFAALARASTGHVEPVFYN
jgi:hypothetical protein